MSDPVTVPVSLGDRAYDVHIGVGVIDRLGAGVRDLFPRGRALIVTDEHVAALHLDRAKASLDAAGVRHETIVVPAGEGSKCFTVLEQVMSRLLDFRIERRDAVVALGGGVIGDLAGFAASIAKRGVDFVQVPTTLLSQVDSSVGGKTGINTPQGKNLVGAFHQPRLVLADTGLLETLPRRELLAGYAEVVKYGLLGDAAFFDWLEVHGPALVAGDRAARIEAVRRSVTAKAGIVSRDEKETGERALLNLGHTFGHALEAATGFGQRLLHGEGVAIGMRLAFDLSVDLGLCPGQDAVRARRHMAAVGLPVAPSDIEGAAQLAGELAPDALIHHMAQDKKVKDGKLTFILARRIGEAFITQDVAIDAVERVLRAA
ncbi:3-dehydroquinate synthase [Zavarzinia aquatilis]|uniref:3-dehydroquinate synthase n=1 Tax=Zavarzinia aquatilis TaxID=2211142 RepID=A0A317E0E1_9PROT|nr:3-dehydroquinate synthase [Zavarzinia aquatilis]PWR18625.1 3-dehydroquinate synthase [Zavarzinia aquatilis]